LIKSLRASTIIATINHTKISTSIVNTTIFIIDRMTVEITEKMIFMVN
jgi:hypothetical protein